MSPGLSGALLFDYSAPYELTLPPSLERLVSEERLKNQISFWGFATFKGASIEAPFWLFPCGPHSLKLPDTIIPRSSADHHGPHPLGKSGMHPHAGLASRHSTKPETRNAKVPHRTKLERRPGLKMPSIHGKKAASDLKGTRSLCGLRAYGRGCHFTLTEGRKTDFPAMDLAAHVGHALLLQERPKQGAPRASIWLFTAREPSDWQRNNETFFGLIFAAQPGSWAMKPGLLQRSQGILCGFTISKYTKPD